MKTTSTFQEAPPAENAKNESLEVLRNAFIERKSKNKAYSLSSYARDFGISTAVLSRILSEKRPLSLKLAMHMAAVLELDDTQTKRMLLSALKSQSKNAKVSKKVKERLERDLTDCSQKTSIQYTGLDMDQFKAMAQWHHLALLNLMTLPGFRSTPHWAAKRLGISSIEVRDAYERMFALGLIIESNGTLKRSKKNLYVHTSKSELGVRTFHTQMIDKAKAELLDLRQERFEKRLITGTTLTCAREHVPLIKEKIARFQKEILDLTNTKPETELYQMNLQFFPLTQDGK